MICYSSTERPDDATERLRQAASEWHDVFGLPDEHVAKLVVEHGVDILVDLTGHENTPRLGVFARRPAPVQVTYLGYPNTTGLPAIDYRLTDAWADPPGRTERWHTEKPVRLPGGFLAYTPPRLSGRRSVPAPCWLRPHSLAPSTTSPKYPRRRWTFGPLCCARCLVRACCGSAELDEAEAATSIAAQFRAAGVSADRIELRSRTRDEREHLRMYGEVDICLDPHPYNGTKTTCDALWQGVPLITLAGRNHRSRVGTSILNAFGLPELVAQSPEQYVEVAARLASDPGELDELRQGLRGRLAASPLSDHARLAREIERAYAWMIGQAGEARIVETEGD